MYKTVVSVIVPVYNSESVIVETLESVRRQTYNEWECIIVDDCSIDQSLNVVTKYLEKIKDSRFAVLRLNENSGVAAARNLAISKSQGEFCAFLDSDDIWNDNKLKFQMDFMLKRAIDFSYSSYHCFSQNGISDLIKVPGKVNRGDLLKTCPIYTSTVVVKRSLIERGMPVHLRKRQDYVTWLYILETIDFAYSVNVEEGLMMYRLRSDSISANKINVARIQWKIYRHELGINVFSSMYYFLSYMLHGFGKRVRQVNLRG